VTGVRTVRVADAAAIGPGELLPVAVDGEPLVLVNVDGVVHALQGICSHEEYELDQGFLLGDTLTCMLHGSRFSVVTGEALDPPAETPLYRYDARIEDGGIWVDLPTGGVVVNSELR
jgi:3-phenylpropionate/trans-cinnamate dioxygenase ferredoxin component